MTDTPGVKAVDLKWFGTLTPKQILGLVAAFAFALILTIYGFGTSCMCFGMLIIAIILYMLPRLLGVENIKLLAVFGAVFMATAVLVGGFVTAPGFVENNQDPPGDNDYFTDVQYIYVNGGVEITATLTEDIGAHEVYFKYGEVRGVTFNDAYATFDKQVQLTATGTDVSGYVELDPSILVIGRLVKTETNDEGQEVINDNTGSYAKFMVGAFEGNLTSLCLYGCLIGIIYIMIIYFMVVFLSAFMRSRMEKTREKMEKEGRLYPQGYGRCENCGTVVLPGEVNCRKCGAYIDRPEEMKPKKKDYFECSECGAEVPSTASFCTKCGAKFDDDE